VWHTLSINPISFSKLLISRGMSPELGKCTRSSKKFDGVSYGSFRAGKSDRENYRQIGLLGLTVFFCRLAN
jgi:hypothetical protein